MDEASSGTNKALVGLIVVVLLVAAAAAVFIASSTDQQNDASTMRTIRTAADSSSQNSSKNHQYADGSYSARGNYITPGGNESIDVTVTLDDGVVTSATIVQNALSNEAKQFQSRFASGFEDKVLGKKIDDINLSRVAGSSLTPIGFHNALEEIKKDARI